MLLEIGFSKEARKKKDMPSFTKQHRREKAKEVYRALKREHPEYSAGKKARIAEATADKTAAAVIDVNQGKQVAMTTQGVKVTPQGIINKIEQQTFGGITHDGGAVAAGLRRILRK